MFNENITAGPYLKPCFTLFKCALKYLDEQEYGRAFLVGVKL
jgi:hypothetical protein